eukprot:353504-Chlamydomonas_euryale.AAC.12
MRACGAANEWCNTAASFSVPQLSATEGPACMGAKASVGSMGKQSPCCMTCVTRQGRQSAWGVSRARPAHGDAGCLDTPLEVTICRLLSHSESCVAHLSHFSHRAGGVCGKVHQPTAPCVSRTQRCTSTTDVSPSTSVPQRKCGAMAGRPHDRAITPHAPPFAGRQQEPAVVPLGRWHPRLHRLHPLTHGAEPRDQGL